MLRGLLRKLIVGKKANSESYVKYLRSKGMRIGERTVIYTPSKTRIDETRPWLIEIGDDVSITEGVTILTHGFDWSVVKGVYGEILGSSGKVKIGNNVFAGMNTTILKGVTIGNNVIIGANSLVTNDIQDNCVAVGNPAKVIMSLEEYYKKRKALQLQEAQELVREYRAVYNKEPDEAALQEFFWLFTDGSNELPEIWDKKLEFAGNYEKSKKMLKNNKKGFNGMKDFLDSVK